jgi:hypothetical protein
MSSSIGGACAGWYCDMGKAHHIRAIFRLSNHRQLLISR